MLIAYVYRLSMNYYNLSIAQYFVRHINVILILDTSNVTIYVLLQCFNSTGMEYLLRSVKYECTLNTDIRCA